jgi:enamine deaminase RidA (YjgF/YER057c/UK114 family)
VSELEVPDPESRLAGAGHVLPSAAPVVGLYAPATRAGDVVFTSGSVPMRDGELSIRGKVGAGVTIAQAQDAARLALLNALAAVVAETGSLRRVMRILRLTGYIASAPGFTDQPQVMDAASQLLLDAFGEGGRCARSAIGVAELPLGAPVEIELVVLLR